MSDQATKIVESLKEGNISEAIELINSGIHEKATARITSIREDVAKEYGFGIVEAEKEEADDEEEESDDDGDDKKEKDKEEEDE